MSCRDEFTSNLIILRKKLSIWGFAMVGWKVDHLLYNQYIYIALCLIILTLHTHLGRKHG